MRGESRGTCFILSATRDPTLRRWVLRARAEVFVTIFEVWNKVLNAVDVPMAVACIC